MGGTPSSIVGSSPKSTTMANFPLEKNMCVLLHAYNGEDKYIHKYEGIYLRIMWFLMTDFHVKFVHIMLG